MYIKSNAYSKSRIERAITRDSEHLNDHLVKLALFPDSEYVSHWMDEIHAFLPRVYKQKANNRFPDKGYIYNLLSGENDNIPAIRQNVLDIENELKPEERTDQELLIFMDNYHRWVSEQLAERGFVKRSDVREFLTSEMNR